MRLSGLTLSITVTFVLVLCGSLALGLFVTVVFWQRSLMRAEEARVQFALSQISRELDAGSRKGEPVGVERLRRFVEDDVLLLDGLSYYDGKNCVSFPGPECDGAIERVVRSCALTQQYSCVSHDSIWAAVSPGIKTLIVARPVDLYGGPGGSLATVVEMEPIYSAFRREIKMVGTYVAVNIIIFTVIGLYRMISLVVRPIERMARVSESYSVAEGARFSGMDTGSEFSRLSMALNSMLLRIELDREELRRTVSSLARANEELRKTQREMVQAEKYAAVGRLSAGLAHEIGNPLGIVQGYVELLGQSDLAIDDRRLFAERALEELGRIDRLIRRLLDFARTRPRRKEMFGLQKVFEELRDMFAAQARRFGVELTVKAGDEVRLLGDRDGIKQVLLNCLINSFDAVEAADRGKSGQVTVSASVEAGGDGGEYISIIISDNGIGLDGGEAPLLFEPFYSTKEPGKGTGLGLSVSRAIIEAHGGTMDLAGVEGAGAQVIIELPVAGDDEHQPGDSSDGAATPSRH
ncbi:MAG: HAMP domain-containing histidine kinase [Desulfobulbaceae bacterium]|nr:HAMP domain-containing histidine kinase [Desulfobulbaceae bacterium]